MKHIITNTNNSNVPNNINTIYSKYNKVDKHCFVITVQAKLILFGEHIVFYNNNNSIGIPLPFMLRATFNVNTTAFHIISDSKVEKGFIEHVKKVCACNNIRISPCNIHIESTIPIGGGYGSSAALCVALARGLYLRYFHGLPLNEPARSALIQDTAIKDIWNIAHQLEYYFHNPASGIDTALCSYGQPLLILSHVKDTQQSLSPQLTVHPLVVANPEHPLYIVSAVVPREGSAKKYIAQVRQALQQDKQLRIVEQWHHIAIGQLMSYYQHRTTLQSQNAFLEEKHAIATQTYSKEISFDYSIFAHAVQNLQEQFCAIGLCTHAMKNAMNIAIQAGSIATKLSGAGGGGAFICFCKNQYDADSVRTALQQGTAVYHICGVQL